MTNEQLGLLLMEIGESMASTIAGCIIQQPKDTRDTLKSAFAPAYNYGIQVIERGEKLAEPGALQVAAPRDRW